MTLYQIEAAVEGVQVPIFYLDADVQGIISLGQAARIAHDILTIGKRNANVAITATRITLDLEPGHNPVIHDTRMSLFPPDL